MLGLRSYVSLNRPDSRAKGNDSSHDSRIVTSGENTLTDSVSNTSGKDCTENTGNNVEIHFQVILKEFRSEVRL